MSDIKKPAKKRSTLKHRSSYDLPKWAVEDKQHAYRWIKETKVSDRNDGYDPRGWVQSKIPAGNDGAGERLRFKEMVLAQMPIDEHEALKQEKADAILFQTESVMGAAKELEAQATHEFRNAGGKLKLNVSLE